MRPIHIALANLISHNAFLHAKHQNFALKLKPLKSTSAKINVNLDRCQQSLGDVTSSLEMLSSDSIPYDVWRKVVDILRTKSEKDVTMKKKKFVDTEMQKEDFKLCLLKNLLNLKDMLIE